MIYVYKLEHNKKVELDLDGKWIMDTKMIGFFSSEEKCQQVINHYKTIEGFKEYPNDFMIEKITVDFDDFDFV